MIIRYIDVDLMEGSSQTGQLEGNLVDDYEAIRQRVETVPGHKFVALADETRLNVDVDGYTEEQVRALIAPEDSVVRIPTPSEIEYDIVAGWFVAVPRPSFEEATGKTKADFVADMVARGMAENLAQVTVDAREGEYDAYDPLEGVHLYGTPIEDIMQAAIVAAEARAARRSA